LVEEVGEGAALHQFVEVGMAAIEVAKEMQRLAHGHEILQRRALEHQPDFLEIVSAHRGAAEADLAGAGRGDPFQHFHGGGLAGAIGAQQAEAPSFGNDEAHPVHGPLAAIVLEQLAGFQQGRGHGPYNSKGDRAVGHISRC
jgi:hypothetical protein